MPNTFSNTINNIYRNAHVITENNPSYFIAIVLIIVMIVIILTLRMQTEFNIIDKEWEVYRCHPKYAFIGTSAWLFLIVNICKVPFMIDLEIITVDSIKVSGWLFIPAIIGAIFAPIMVRHLNQKIFENMIWFFIVLAGLRMIF